MKSHNSHHYQYIYHEICTSDDFLVSFSNDHSFTQNESQYLLELKDKLFTRVLRLAPGILTKKQFQVFKMYYIDNISTPSIAKELGVNISCVRNQLKGRGTNKGALPKLKNSLFKDEICLDLLRQIEDHS